MTLADQLKIDRVQPQPYTRAQVEIERELFADRPPLRDPHEAQQMSLKEWIAASGLDAEHRKFAKGAISAIAADTRKALSVYRDGKQRGIDQMVLAEIVREGVIRGQEAIRAAGNAEMSKGADASARFHALHAIAEKHGLRINGDFDPAKHGHGHMDQLAEMVAGKAAERAASPGDQDSPPYRGESQGTEDEPEDGDDIDRDDEGRPSGGKVPTAPHDKQRLAQQAHDILDGLDALARRIAGTPLEAAHTHLMKEGAKIAERPSPEAVEHLCAQVAAFKMLATGRSEDVGKSLMAGDGTVYVRTGDRRSAALIAADLRYQGIFALDHGDAIHAIGLAKSDVPADAVLDPVSGGWWVGMAAAERIAGSGG